MSSQTHGQLLVAGGGGGAGAIDPYAGAGGGQNGLDSVPISQADHGFLIDFGRGGTQSQGGIPMDTSYMYDPAMNGQKDKGGDCVISDDGGAGGGGGGYYGGSSGNDSGGGGGGGGSSYTDPVIQNAMT